MNQVIVSPLNGIRLVPANVTSNPRFNRQQFDNEWYYELIYSFQKKVFYAQPIQNKDYLSLQVLANAGATITLKLLTCGGITKMTGTFTEYLGVMPTINGVASSYYTFSDFQFWDNIASGIYYLSIEIAFADSTIALYLSEPLSVEAKHENTVLIEYQNSYNKDNILFEQTYQKFCLRVPGAMKLSPVSTKNVFQDQGYSSVLLSGTAYRKWDFNFGGEGNYLPEYMFDMLNHVFAIDHIRIDGKNFTVIDDSSLDLEDVDLYPLTAAKISLGEAENMDSFRHLSGNLFVTEIPAFPFTFWGLSLINSGFVDYNIELPRQITSSSILTSYIGSLNADLLTKGLTGSFSIIHDSVTNTDKLYYNLGSDESYDDSECTLLTKYFTTSLISTTSGLVVKHPYFDLDANGCKMAIFDSLTNTPVVSDIVSELKTYIGSVALNQNTSSQRVYFDDKNSFTYVRIYNEANVYAPIGNDIPEMMGEFIVNDATQTTSFNIYPTLTPAKDNLFRVQLNNCGLTNFGIVVPESGTPFEIWKQLKQFYMMGNPISLTPSPNAADNFINNVSRYAILGYHNSNTQLLMGGTVVLSNSPTLPYTSASQSTRDNLEQNLNWQIH